MQSNCKRIFNLIDLNDDGSQFDLLFSEGDCILLGGLEIRIMDTPGHTPDSITYLVEDAAFIGDTLFAPNRGSARCDFPGGSAGLLFDSIEKLYALPAQTRLFLCHDYPDAGNDPVCCIPVAQSVQENIHVIASTLKDDYIQLKLERDAQLGLPKLILPALQVNVLAGRAPAPESGGVPYLKIPFNQTFADLLAPGHVNEK